MLKKLSCSFGMSGFEEDVSGIIIEKIRPFADLIQKDNIGNIYAYKKGKNPKRTIALFAHTDEVGMLVHNITEEGFLKILPIGIDAGVLTGKRVLIGENRVKGVIGSRAVHLVSKEERKKKIPIESLYIDIGAESKQEAEKYVKKGDPVYFDSVYKETKNHIFGKAFDDRAGCEILTRLIEEQYSDNVYFVFTAQEETGTRGAMIASRRIDADLFVVVENTTCLDIPEVPKEKMSTRLGAGPALTVVDSGAFSDVNIRQELICTGIKYQFKNVAAGGNDARAISQNGKQVSAISVPCRYLHTPIGVICKEDFNNTYLMLLKFLKGENLC